MKMYDNMKLLPGEKNWYNCVAKLLKVYKISLSEEEIKNHSKESFKGIVKKAITQVAHAELMKECNNQKKTSSLVYSQFKPQDYLSKLYPWQSKLISRCRSKTLAIKTHQPFRYKDSLCRWCNLQDETLSHILNCGEEPLDEVDLTNIEKMDSELTIKLSRMSYRIQEFMEKTNY